MYKKRGELHLIWIAVIIFSATLAVISVIYINSQNTISPNEQNVQQQNKQEIGRAHADAASLPETKANIPEVSNSLPANQVIEKTIPSGGGSGSNAHSSGSGAGFESLGSITEPTFGGTFNYTEEAVTGELQINDSVELPNNQGIDLNRNMTGNTYLGHFNNDSLDYSGTGNNAALSGNAIYNCTEKMFGNCSITIPDTTANSGALITGTNLYSKTIGSVSFWFNPAFNSGTAVIRTFVSTRNDNSHLFTIIHYSDGNIYAGWYNGAEYRVVVSSAGLWTANTWHHMTLTWNDDTDLTILYIDGTERGRTTTLTTIPLTTAYTPMGFEYPYGASKDGFTGIIDEWNIWNRSLSAQEVFNLYSASKGDYQSEIFNAGTMQNWNNISWVQESAYNSAELPNNLGTDGSYIKKSVNMTGNVLLLHLNNDSSVGENSALAYDYSGNGNNASLDLNNGHRPLWDTTTKVLGAGSLKFINTDKMTINFTQSLNFTSAITISVWYNTASASNTNPIYKYGTFDLLHYSNGICYFELTTTGLKQLGTASALPLNKWVLLTATYESGAMKIYVNGALSNSRADVTGDLTQAYGTNVIQTLASNTMYIDEVAVWNRTVSANEIEDLYLRGAGTHNISVRSCDDSACSGEDWNATYTTSPQNLSVAENQYFQYRIDLGRTDPTLLTPELWNVTISNSESADYDSSINSSDIVLSPSAPKDQETATINATAHNTGSSNLTDLNISFYVDNVYKNSTLANISVGESSIVQFTWTAENGLHTIKIQLDPANLISESNETNNEATKAVDVKVITTVNITSPLEGAEIVRGKDTGSLPHEDAEHIASNYTTISAKVYDYYNSNLGISNANCSFYFGANSLGSNTTNSSGICSYTFDKSAYTNQSYTITVNYTDSNSSHYTNSSLENDNINVFLIKILTDLDPINLRGGSYHYNDADASVLNVTITKDGAAYDPYEIVVEMRNTGEGVLQDHSTVSGGDGYFIKDSTGNYRFVFILETDADIHWHVYPKDSGSNYEGSALHGDVTVNPATGHLNLSIVDEHVAPITNGNILLYDGNGYRLVNLTTSQIYIRDMTLNDNYTLKMSDSSGDSMNINKFRMTDNSSVTAQFDDTESVPSLTYTTTSVALDSNHALDNATIRINTTESADKIAHCSNWNTTTSNCDGTWQINSTSDYAGFVQGADYIQFTVTSLSAYAGGGTNNSQLYIYDDTDTLTRYTGEQNKFYANYSRTNDSEPIQGANNYCEFTENSTGSWSSIVNMTYNSTSKLYEYNKTINNRGTHYFNVSCYSNVYNDLSAQDDFIINNSKLYIYDGADTAGGGNTYYAGDPVLFYANYTNTSDNSHISGASCSITVDGSTDSMFSCVSCLGDANYYYNLTAGFASSGAKQYNITCSKAGYDTVNKTDTVNINSFAITAIPEFSDYAMILIILTAICGFFLVKRRKGI